MPRLLLHGPELGLPVVSRMGQVVGVRSPQVKQHASMGWWGNGLQWRLKKWKRKGESKRNFERKIDRVWWLAEHGESRMLIQSHPPVFGQLGEEGACPHSFCSSLKSVLIFPWDLFLFFHFQPGDWFPYPAQMVQGVVIWLIPGQWESES